MASLFETKTCTRCGGSGEYSYNRMHGTVCYGCSGTKVQLTPRGKAAQAWFTAQQTVPASALQVGDLVHAEDYSRGRAGWFRVAAIDGVEVTLTYRDKGRDQVHQVRHHGFPTYRRRPGDAWGRRWQQAVGLAYQASLTQAGTPRRR